MTRMTTVRLVLVSVLTVLLVGCGTQTGGADQPTPGSVGEVTEDAGPVPEMSELPTPEG